jgi:eukaryotic-like serine/threonine-protein kinase
MSDYTDLKESILSRQLEKGESTLLKLKQRFDNNKSFPAMSNSISQIMKISTGIQSQKKIADIILQDQALASKILSIVNSSSYNQFGGAINTVSRAVVILGLDQIQSIAVSFIVFEKLNKGPMSKTLKSYACQSFLSAYFAKKLVENVKTINYEEAFLASMFHNLGKQVALYFFQDEYNVIQVLQQKQQLDDDEACEKILGLKFCDIGQFIALELKLPNNIILGIQSKPKIITERPKRAEDYLGQLASITNEIVETAACGDHVLVEKRLHNIIERYKVSFSLEYDRVLKMLIVLSETLLNYCSTLGINPAENTFCLNFINFVQSQQELEQKKSA